MNVRPFGPLAWPSPAASLRPADDSPESIAQDVLDSGIEIRAKRRWWFGTRKLDAEETAEKLREAKRPLQVVVKGVTLPLLSTEDLTEVAVFSHLRPVQLLPHRETAEHLQALEKLGPTFVNQEGESVGGYGAYNALTDPAHKNLAVQMQIGDQRLALEMTGLPGLAAFYQNDPLGKLELEGYQFFDAQGSRRPSYGSQTPDHVGKNRERWLPVNTPDLETSLEKFAQLRKETQRVDSARAVFNLKPTQAEIDSLLKNYGEQQVIPGIMREVARLPAPEVLKLAGSLRLGTHGQRAFLELLQCPLALEIHKGCQSTQTQSVVYREALKQPPLSNGVEVAQFLSRISAAMEKEREAYYRQPDLTHLGKVALAELQKFPETRPGAACIASWEPALPYGPVKLLLQNPTVSKPEELRLLAAGTEPSDQKLRAKVLESLKDAPSAPMVEKAMAACQTDLAKTALLRAFVRHPEVRDGHQAAALFRDAFAQVPLDPNDYYNTQNRNQLGSAALEALQGFPDTEKAAARVRAWKPANPFGPAERLVQNPDADMRKIALGVAPTDQQAQKAVLDELAVEKDSSAGVARVAWEKCYNHHGKHAAYKAAVQFPTIKDGREAAKLLELIARRIDRSDDRSYKYYNQSGLGTAAIEVLQKFPDTRVAAEKVASWNPSAPHGIARALLKNPTASTTTELRQIALGTDPDVEMEKRILTEMQADPATATAAGLALEAMGPVYSTSGKHAVFQAALQNPSITTGVEAAVMFRQIKDRIDQNKQDNYLYHNQLGLGTAVLTALQKFPDTAEGAARVTAWKSAQPYGVGCALLDNPTAKTPAELRQIALKGSPGDQAMEKAVFAELKADPATEQAATLLEKAYDATSYATKCRTAMFRTALSSPRVETGAQAAKLFQKAFADVRAAKDEYQEYALQALGKAALEALQSFPDTRAGAEKVLSYGPTRPAGVAEALLKNPVSPDLQAVLLACDASDHTFQDNVMAAQPCGEEAKKLSDSMYGSAGKACVYRTFLGQPEAKSGVEVAALLQKTVDALDASGDRYNENNLNKLSARALETLQAFPDTQKAAARVAGWKPGKPTGPVRELLKTPTSEAPDDLRRYALAADPNETAMTSNVLAELGTPIATLGKNVMEQMYGSTARNIAYRMGLSGEPLTSGAEAREALKKLEKAMRDSNDEYKAHNQTGMARAIVTTLKDYPDTKAEAEKVARWGPQPTYQVARILLDNPQLLSLKALDTGFLTVGNAAREEAVLNELMGDPKSEIVAQIARVSCENVKRPETRHALVLAALMSPELRTSEDVDAYFEQAKSLQRHESDQLDSLCEIYRTGFGLGKQSGLGLAEEEERVLVGGVVVRKR